MVFRFGILNGADGCNSVIESGTMEREDQRSGRVELRECCGRVVRLQKTCGIVLFRLFVMKICVKSGEK